MCGSVKGGAEGAASFPKSGQLVVAFQSLAPVVVPPISKTVSMSMFCKESSMAGIRARAARTAACASPR